MSSPGSSDTFHSRVLPSWLVVTSVLPSRLKATPATRPGPALNGGPISWWVSASHNRALPSAPPVARVFPSRLKATAYIGPLRGRAVPLERPRAALLRAAAFQRRTVPSSPDVTRILPSGLKATDSRRRLLKNGSPF